ncbi:MAG: phage minor head protein [Archaeoglobaceae archaeon]
MFKIFRRKMKVLSGKGLFAQSEKQSDNALTVEWLSESESRRFVEKCLVEKKGVVITGPPPVLGRLRHPPNIQFFEKIYAENGVVNAAINTLTELTVGVGFFTESSDEKAKKLVDEYAEKVNLDGLLRVICRNCFIFGFSPVERWWENNILQLKPLPPQTVYAIIDAKGNVKGYQQKTWSGEYIDFSIDEIIWFSPFAYPGNPYGIGKISPIYSLTFYRNEILQNFALIVKRHARPPAVWLMRADPENVKREAEKRSPDQDFFLGPIDPEKDLKIIFPEISARGQYENMFEALNQEIYEGLQAPLLTWLKNSTEASAKVQLEVIQRHVSGIQRYFKRIVEREIFTPLIRKAGLSETPRLRWGVPQTGVENLTIRDIAMLVQAYVITPKQAIALLRKIGLPIEEQVEKRAEERAPLVEYALWKYHAVGDDKTCADCMRLNNRVFNAESNELKAIFQYGELISHDTFKPNIHPNCRCILKRVYSGERYG